MPCITVVFPTMLITSFGHSVGLCIHTTKTSISAAPCKQTKPGHVKYSQKWSVHQISGSTNLKPYHEDHQIVDYKDEWLSMEHSQKLREVGNVLRQRAEEEEDCLVQLRLVDGIQRLGIDHLFQEEIAQLLHRHYSLHIKGRFHHNHPSLDEVSQFFRLLRQGGHFVSPDAFKKFMDEKGRFNLETKTSNLKALMALYEAAQLSIEGEYILDAAAKISGQHLNACMSHLGDQDARIVAYTLRHPFRKSLAATSEIEEEGINGMGKSLHELAYVENYMAKRIHGQELHEISKWWEDLGIVNELEDARDQPTKWYAWSIASLKDLSMSDERVDLTKTVSFIYLIDDIFDLYGKPEDLNLFTEAVNRWELEATEQLPDYMKKCFRALYIFTNEAGLNIQKRHGFNPVESLRKTWGDLCNAFLTESRWFASGSDNMPTVDEYLDNAKVSSGLHVVAVHMFFLLGFGTETKSPISLDDASGIISSVATILRLWDDLGSSEDEGQCGHDGSFIDYYLNDHKGVTVEFAREIVINMISDEWKKLNMECLCLDQSSSSFQKGILNLARMVPLMYNYNDRQRLPDLQDYIEVVL